MNKQDLLDRISSAVLEMEEDQVTRLCKTYIDEGYPALEGILDGLVRGMSQAGQLFDEDEYFITDLLLCSDAMYCGLEVLRPHLTEAEGSISPYKIVIGVVEGDTHDIGKNLVKIMLETAGFEMIDLGRDVEIGAFVEKAEEVGAHIICLSTLMTTTMSGMKEVIDLLEAKEIRHKYKVMVGGGPISQRFSDQIGADGYSDNAIEAVKLAKKLVGL